eukprot:14837558-Ditylum_brightwellii.AAC.1
MDFDNVWCIVKQCFEYICKIQLYISLVSDDNYEIVNDIGVNTMKQLEWGDSDGNDSFLLPT